MGKEIQILLTLKSKFVSVNSLYNARVQYKNGKPIAVIYKNPEANRVETEIRNQLLAVDFSENREWLRETKKFDLDLKFILKKNASHRDSSNLTKNLEDIWTRFVVNDLGIEEYDDSMHVRVTAEKALIPGADNEYAILILREHKGDIRFDIEPKPENIWISGFTLDETTAYLPPLPKKLKKKEKYMLASEHDKADTKVFILQPQNFTQISPTLISTAYKDAIDAAYSNFGFVFVGVLGSKEEWQSTEWDQIEWLRKEIDEITQNYKNVKFGRIEKMEELLEWMK